MQRSVWNAILFAVSVAWLTGLILLCAARLRPARAVVRPGLVLKRDGAQALADPETGTMEMRRPDGSSIRFGGASLPAWIPAYPGSSARDVFRMEDGKGGGSVSFGLDEHADAVCRKLPAAWSKAGLGVRELPAVAQGGCMLLVEVAAQKLTAILSVGTAEKGSTVNVTYTKK